MPTTQKRYESLQILRALAAWMIVGNHYQQMYFNYYYDNLLSEFFVKHGAFGIDLFFVLSGFVMCLTASRAGTHGLPFFLRRVLRIAPAYWVFTGVLLVWVVLFPNVYAYTDYNALSLLKSVLLIPGENPSGIGMLPFLTPGWTLIYEFAFYTTLSACLLFTPRYGLQLCFVAIIALRFLLPDDLSYSPILTNSRMLEFISGIAIGWYVQSGLLEWFNRYIPRWLQVAALLCIAWVLMSGLLLNLSLGTRAVAASCIVLGLVLIDQTMQYQHTLWRFLVRSGNYSYSVYLSHVLVIGMFLGITGPWLPWYGHMGIVIAIVLTTHAVSSLSYRWVENGPPVRALRGKINALKKP